MWHDQLLKVGNERLVDMWLSIECATTSRKKREQFLVGVLPLQGPTKFY